MTIEQIKYIVFHQTGQYLKPMRSARKGAAFEAKLLNVMLMHEEGYPASQIADAMAIERTAVYHLIKAADALLSAAPGMPDYNKGFKVAYQGCCARRAKIEHAETVQAIDPERIIAVICAYACINNDAIKAKRMIPHIIEAREIAMSLIRYYNPSMGYEAIGQLLGGFNHSTVGVSLQRVEDKLVDDPIYRMKYDNIVNLLENGERASA